MFTYKVAEIRLFAILAVVYKCSAINCRTDYSGKKTSCFKNEAARLGEQSQVIFNVDIVKNFKALIEKLTEEFQRTRF